MLDPAIAALAERLLAPAIAEHDDTLRREIRAIREQMVARGILGSSVEVNAVASAYVAQISVRAQLIFAQLRRALESTPGRPAHNLADDLKAEFRRLLHQFCPELPQTYSSIPEQFGLSLPHRVEEAVAREEKRYDAEFDLAVVKIGMERGVEPTLLSALELKPSIGGVGINLNLVFQRIAAWWRRRRWE